MLEMSEASRDERGGAPRLFLSRIALPILALILVVCISSVGLLRWTAQVQSDQARGFRASLVSNGHVYWQDRISQTAVYNAVYAPVVEFTRQRPDPKILAETFTPDFLSSINLSASFILRPDNSTVFARSDGQILASADLDQLSPAALRLIAKVRRTDHPAGKGLGAVVTYRNGPAYIGVANIEPESETTSKQRSGHVLVLLGPLDASISADIGDKFKIPGLMLVPGVAESPVLDSKAIVSADGQRVATYLWQQPRETFGMWRDVLPWTSVALLGVLALTAMILRNAKAAADSLAYSEARAQALAQLDPLTNLANRRSFLTQLEERHTQGGHDATPLALLFIDLDGFKHVNDSRGHEQGDALLRRIAALLGQVIEPGDTLARLGGDEFAVLQSGKLQPESAEATAERIIAVLRSPLDLDGYSAHVGASIGIAFMGDEDTDPSEALRRADMAMYGAKRDGRNRWCIYSPTLDTITRERAALKDELRNALANNHFFLDFQPLIDVEDNGTHRITGVEALVRWRHPERGLINPGTFIPIAEDNGLIVPLGEWVLREACRAARRWPEVVLSVNLSPAQFNHPDLAAQIKRVLEEVQFPASRLELEITEGVLLRQHPGTQRMLDKLREMGIRLALDDLGTGFSSLSYLANYRFDTLKIDRGFVEQMADSQPARAIVHALVSLGKTLGTDVVAEGVETRDQVQLLADAGCHILQGYYFGRPMPALDIDRMVGRQHRLLPERVRA
jgi:diguanylate cyclase (GGDEF)-like protein